jgi:UrcA family protein
MPALKIVEICVAASLVTALAPAAQTQAQAQPQPHDPTVVAGVAYVPYGDLDLASPSGEKMLSTRVWKAAKKLCRVEVALMDFVTQVCIRNAYQGARPQILSAIEQAGSPSLAAKSGTVLVSAR